MEDMVFAMTLAPWPVVLCHGTNRDDVAIRGLSRLASMGFDKTKPLCVGTLEELEETVGVAANAVVRTYWFGRASVHRPGRMNEARVRQCQRTTGATTSPEVILMKDLSDIANELLEELAQVEETQQGDGKTDRVTRFLRHVHDVLGVPYPDDWVCRYVSHSLTHMVVIEDETLDEMWPGGNLEDEDELLDWLNEYPLAIQTIDQAREEFGCCDSFIKDVAMGLELMSKTIFDTVYHYLVDLAKA